MFPYYILNYVNNNYIIDFWTVLSYRGQSYQVYHITLYPSFHLITLYASRHKHKQRFHGIFLFLVSSYARCLGTLS